MATTQEDYYALLGVDRAASHAEIKQAFRRLARELHPDVSTEPDAGRRFRAVAEAYEVLSDPEKLPKPYRSYRAGYVFRNEKPGPGRFRQFMQFDADTVGATGQGSVRRLQRSMPVAVGLDHGHGVPRCRGPAE